jgi:CheY-like chemotaxis protein/ABC-type transporter Mla MlaB component
MELRLDLIKPGLLSFRCIGALSQLHTGGSTDPLRTFFAQQSFEGNVLLDLSGVGNICTEGIAWLVHWHRCITKSGGVMGLCSVPTKFKEFFELCKLQDLMPIWENETEGRAALTSSVTASSQQPSSELVLTRPPETNLLIEEKPLSDNGSTALIPISSGNSPGIARRSTGKVVEILIVDDSAVERRRAGTALHKLSGSNDDDSMNVLYASNGIEALDIVHKKRPSLVVTDLVMPGLDGLGLVKEMRSDYPSIPVVLMTAHGSEEIAAEALRFGAASYVPKKYLARDLSETVETILRLAHVDREQMIFPFLKSSEYRFLLPTNMGLISPLVDFLQGHLERLKLCHEMDELRVAVALREALVNSFVHGNLDVPSELRETDPESYIRCLAERQYQAPYKDRHVHVSVRGTQEEVVYTIRDEGFGFDTSFVPDPTDLNNLKKATGRGLYLIRNFMNEVKFNDVGNEITLIKRRSE